MTLTKFLLIAAFATGVWAQDVKIDYDQDEDFSKYKTYKWVTLKSPVTPDQLTDARIRRTIDAELAKKGMTKTESDSADLYLGYQASLTEETSMTTFGTGGYGWGYGARWGGYGGGMTTTTVDKIPMGNLVVDLYEVSDKKLVFRSMASGIEVKNDSPEKKDKRAAKVVAKMFKKYPPKAKK